MARERESGRDWVTFKVNFKGQEETLRMPPDASLDELATLLYSSFGATPVTQKLMRRPAGKHHRHSLLPSSHASSSPTSSSPSSSAASHLSSPPPARPDAAETAEAAPSLIVDDAAGTSRNAKPSKRLPAAAPVQSLLKLADLQVAAMTLAQAGILDGASLTLLASTDSDLSSVSGRIDDPLMPSFDEEAARERRRQGWGPSGNSSSGYTGGVPVAPLGGYGFGGFRVLQPGDVGLGSLSPPPEEALKLMYALASDWGIKAVVEKYRWRVGILTEMPPVGKVGVSPRCVLGFNVNRGQEISLRLRTDDLRGFRKMAVIRSTLIHELTHMVHDDHDNKFKALNSKLVKESQILSSGRTASAFGAGSWSRGGSFHAGFEEHSGGPGAEGQGGAGARTVGGALGPLADPKTMAASAALSRHQHRPVPLPSSSAPPSPAPSDVVPSEAPASGTPPAPLPQSGSAQPSAVPTKGALGPEVLAQSLLPDIIQARPGPDSGPGPCGDSRQEGQAGRREEEEPMSVEPVVGGEGFASGTPQGTDGSAQHKPDSASARDSALAEALEEPPELASPEQTDAMDIDRGCQAPPPEAQDKPAASVSSNARENAQAAEASGSGSPEGAAGGAGDFGEDRGFGGGVSSGGGERSVGTEGVGLGIEGTVPEELSGVASAVGEAQRRLAEAARRLQQEALAGGPQKKEGVVQAVATLRTILRNVMQHPGEQKFRTVKKTSRVFQSSVAQFPAAVELLRVAGFREKEGEGRATGVGGGGGEEGQVLHCRTPDPALLWLACSTLDQLSY